MKIAQRKSQQDIATMERKLKASYLIVLMGLALSLGLVFYGIYLLNQMWIIGIESNIANMELLTRTFNQLK